MWILQKRPVRTLLLAASMTVSGNVSTTEIYHWIDDKGQRHFSDRPSADRQPYQPSIPVHSIPIHPVPTLQVTEHPPAITPPKRRQSAKKKQQTKKNQRTLKKQQQQCQKYEKRIKALQAKLRRGHSNEEGNRWRRQKREYSHLRWKHCR